MTLGYLPGDRAHHYVSSTHKITLGNTLHIPCSSPPEDRALRVGVQALQGLILDSVQCGRE